MNPFDSIMQYLSWHYDGGSKMVWKSGQTFATFVAHAVSGKKMLRLFSVPQSAARTNVLIGITMHLLALVLRTCAAIVGMALTVSSFLGSLVVFILWTLLPFAIIVFVITVVREIVTEAL